MALSPAFPAISELHRSPSRTVASPRLCIVKKIRVQRCSKCLLFRSGAFPA
jgi:hypothetical protein